jgi:hypothetical protein
MTTYKVASEEGAVRYGGQVGDEVELDLPDAEETAVVAAGWLEPQATGKTSKKGE